MSEIDRGSVVGVNLRARLDRSGEAFGTTIVTVEELLRGRLAQLARCKDPQELIAHYARLQNRVSVLSRWLTLRWDGAAASAFEWFSSQRLGVGTMDLRIAGIAIANQATLLSRNLRDFERVRGLIVEDWLI